MKGLCVYNTKDNWKHGERIEEVIDWENSDCLDIKPLAELKMLDKTQSSTSPDTKTYLRELIDHYDLILQSKKIPEELNSFIQRKNTNACDTYEKFGNQI